MKKQYGDGYPISIAGKLIEDFVNPVSELADLPTITLSGTMYGNDECFDNDGFYQILVVDDRKFFHCYYQIPNDCDDLGNIDYKHPYVIKDCTSQYEE